MIGNTQRHLALPFLLASTTLAVTLVGAQDWPQWRGANRDGAIASFKAPSAWPESLKQQWKIEVGTGYATPLLGGKPAVPLQPAGRRRGHVGARRRHRQGDLADGLSGAVHRHVSGRPARPRPEVDASLRERPPVLARHDEHRDRVRRRDGQAAVAEAGDEGAAAVSHRDVADRRGRARHRAHRRAGRDRARGARRRHRQSAMDVERRQPGLRVADRGRPRRHAAGRHVHPSQSGRNLGRRRTAPLAAAVHDAVRHDVADADPLSRHDHSGGPRQRHHGVSCRRGAMARGPRRTSGRPRTSRST